MNWPDHAKHSNDLSSRLFEHEHLFFGKDSLSRDLWWRKYSLQFLGCLPKVVPPRLHMACFVGHEAWVRAILTEEQCSSNSLQDVISEECPGGWLALDYGAQRDSGDIVKLLLDVISESGVPGERLEGTLGRAVLAGREVLVQSILSHGSNVNACDVEGTSLLLHATHRQDKAIMQMLLEHGANPNLSDNDGLRPLEAALRTRRWTTTLERELIDLLLFGGADPNAHTHGGQTLLNLALLTQNHGTVRLLLGHGTNVTLSRVRSTSALSGDAGTTLPRSRSTSPLPYESYPGDDIGIGKIQRQDRFQMFYHGDSNRKRAEDTEDMSLHIAVALRDDIMVELLIAGGADVNMRDGAQRTVIHVVTAEQQDSDDRLPW